MWTQIQLYARELSFQTVVLKKTLEGPLDSKEIKLVKPKGNQPWMFIGRTDAEAEAPILWPPAAKSPITGKDPDAGKDCREEEKGTTEDAMVGWQHRLNGHESEQQQQRELRAMGLTGLDLPPSVSSSRWALTCEQPEVNRSFGQLSKHQRFVWGKRHIVLQWER